VSIGTASPSCSWFGFTVWFLARRYEGLTLEDIPHGKGVLVFGNGLGGGIQNAETGDRWDNVSCFMALKRLSLPGQFEAHTGITYA
jgi:hypothetical protein